jgi:hypothetical protein
MPRAPHSHRRLGRLYDAGHRSLVCTRDAGFAGLASTVIPRTSAVASARWKAVLTSFVVALHGDSTKIESPTHDQHRRRVRLSESVVHPFQGDVCPISDVRLAGQFRCELHTLIGAVSACGRRVVRHRTDFCCSRAHRVFAVLKLPFPSRSRSPRIAHPFSATRRDCRLPGAAGRTWTRPIARSGATHNDLSQVRTAHARCARR